MLQISRDRRRLLMVPLTITTLLLGAQAQEDGESRASTSSNPSFSYDPLSPLGPLSWSSLSFSESIANSPYASFVDQLDFDGNECSPNNNPRPSPLNLLSTAERPFAECIDRHEMLTRQIDPVFTCTPFDATFEITPSTLRMHLPNSDDPDMGGCLRPRINLSGNFPEEFIFHWMDIHVRSEHMINGRRCDGELEMVHMGQGDDDYMMATVSVLLEATARKDHMEFQWFLDQWQKVADEMARDCGDENGRRERKKRGRRRMTTMVNGREEMLERRRQLLSDKKNGGSTNAPAYINGTAVFASEADYLRTYLGSEYTSQQEEEKQGGRKLQYGDASCRSDPLGHGCPGYGKRRKQFPYTLWPTIYYYGYRGSMTTPPCADIVNWRILDVELHISKRQFQQLGQLLQSYRDEDCNGNEGVLRTTGENFRPIQPQGDSEVFHCTFRDFRPFMYLPEDQ